MGIEKRQREERSVREAEEAGRWELVWMGKRRRREEEDEEGIEWRAGDIWFCGFSLGLAEELLSPILTVICSLNHSFFALFFVAVRLSGRGIKELASHHCVMLC